VHAQEDLKTMLAQQTSIQNQLSAPTGPFHHGSGQLIWPVNGPITSPFCERRAWEACHPGIDIGVPSGTPIHAADSGRVTIAGWVSGYGNYTCIQHTGVLSTCYGHQSRIMVSVGQSVSQGQVIGLSGCTGLCFGPHLHFEVRINGAVTNPLNYL
jgi:murein DD-endopeptidase MepM/ murein hydrolase activator NlpD